MTYKEHTPNKCQPKIHSVHMDDLTLARKAATGNTGAQKSVVELVDPLIRSKTKILCKDLCSDNRKVSRCTVDAGWGLQSEDASYCQWGQQSYAWMLEELTDPKRLMAFSSKGGATLYAYLATIVNSYIFRERWRNFRFGRRVRVPEFIKNIHPTAEQIFWWQIDRHEIGTMAQKVSLSVQEVEAILGQIIAELVERKKLYLLDPPKTVSLTGLGGDDEDVDSEIKVADVPDDSWDPIEEQRKRHIMAAFKQLSPVEQFVVESMVMENRKANDVLAGFVKAGVSIKKNLPPEKMDLNQLYYFKNKTLEKMRRFLK